VSGIGFQVSAEGKTRQKSKRKREGPKFENRNLKIAASFEWGEEQIKRQSWKSEEQVKWQSRPTHDRFWGSTFAF